MALAKKAAIDAPSPARTPEASIARLSRVADENRKNVRTHARQQKAAERIAAATGELAAGVAESSAAAEELRKAMESIAAGAEEASAASEQSRKAATTINSGLLQAKTAADISRQKTESLRGLVADTSKQIGASIASIGAGAERQVTSVAMILELERQAASIGDIVRAVATHRRSNESARVECGHRSGARRTARQGIRRRRRRSPHARRDFGKERTRDPGADRLHPDRCEGDRRRRQPFRRGRALRGRQRQGDQRAARNRAQRR